MKRIMALLLAVAIMLFTASCGKKEEEKAPEKFSFTYEGVELVPGEEFDQNCALDGMSVEYDYGDITITTNIDGDKEILDIIYIVDPNITTPEGLALGDDAGKVKELYGQDPKENQELILKRGNTCISIYVSNGAVDSIYYTVA